MSKYKHHDSRLLSWMSSTRTNMTTRQAVTDLGITEHTAQRHITKRFSLLESKGIIVCTRHGSVRTCRLAKDLPKAFEYSQRRRRKPEPKPIPQMKSIKAADSEEFVRNGGKIEVIPSDWDRPIVGKLPVGWPAYNS